MSGHSKWAQIKRQKGVADVKRGQAFTKLAIAITMAVREAGGIGDPNLNFKLRLMVEKARSMNMPKDIIQRAIDRGMGKGGALELENTVYEGFGPGGTAIIIEATTDKKMRTTSEVKNMLEKNGGTMGIPGAVSYQFEQKGLIVVKKTQPFDDIFLTAVDLGAEDVEEVGEEVFIYTMPNKVAEIKNKIVEAGLEIVSFELTRKPVTIVEITDKEKAQKLLNLLEKIEEMDDVQKVYSNFDIPEGLL